MTKRFSKYFSANRLVSRMFNFFLVSVIFGLYMD